MPPVIAESIILQISKISNLVEDAEITLEGNPTSVEAGKFKSFKSAGINRVSLGVQALNDDDLKFLGREHSALEALKAVETAASVFENYTFDLIYARPNQSLENWESELRRALKYISGHMSLYQLTIEKGTPFYSAYNKGKFNMPDSDFSADFYELTSDIMESQNMPAYEVSNHAVAGKESRHNMTYWRYGDYLGIGPGAHSRISLNNNKYAGMMIHHPENWLDSVDKKGQGIQQKTKLSNDEIAEEMIMMGMRIKEGVSVKMLEKIAGRNKCEKILHNAKRLSEIGLLQSPESKIAPTKKGLMLSNYLVSQLLVL